jgi:hypothetical protein
MQSNSNSDSNLNDISESSDNFDWRAVDQEPFTVNIAINTDPNARNVASLDADRVVKGGCNFIQFIAVDTATKKIAGFDEFRRERESVATYKLVCSGLFPGKEYAFLLMMGHWDRDYGTEKSKNQTDWEYKYKNTPPTFLASGLKRQTLASGENSIVITMFPLIVNTLFTGGGQTVDPSVTAGKPEPAFLFPGTWGVRWTLQRASAANNGLESLINAEQVFNPGAKDLTITKKTTIVRGFTDTNAVKPDVLRESGPGTTGNVITLNIPSDYTGALTFRGSVYFNLEYAPFNLTDRNQWIGHESKYNMIGGVPLWIIRNGVNDEPQNDYTNFNNLGKAGYSAYNGNGAVRFAVGINSYNPPAGNLTIRDGVFESITGTQAAVGLTTDGYAGTAGLYYAVCPGGASAPGLGGYTFLENLPKGTHRGKQITLGNSGDDVYVILLKDGTLSGPLKIERGVTIGGYNLYRAWYVSKYGNDSNGGDRAKPLATVQKALENMANAYTASSWPNKGTTGANYGGIVVMDEVSLSSPVIIDDTGDRYPQVVLCDDPQGSGRKALDFTLPGAGDAMVHIIKGAQVILTGSLELKAASAASDVRAVSVREKASFVMSGGIVSKQFTGDGSGVYVDAGRFTMIIGSIIGNKNPITHGASLNGRGVYLCNGSSFEMTGGDIRENTTKNGGNGVYLDNSTFVMRGGTISDNDGDGSGGGVYAANKSTFTMYNGNIVNNDVLTPGTGLPPNAFSGGGVFLYNSSFTLEGGFIRYNTAQYAGGGVSIFSDSPANRASFTMKDGTIMENVGRMGGGGVAQDGGVFTMSGGSISGNYAMYGGGVFLSSRIAARFEKTGGTIYGLNDGGKTNITRDDGSVIINGGRGNAIWVTIGNTYEDNTLGPSNKVSYIYP